MPLTPGVFMAKFDLFLSASPAALLPAIATEVAATRGDDGWCLVVPRAGLARAARKAILAHTPTPGWVGPTVLTVDEMVTHFTATEPEVTALTPLQVRQIIAAVILEMYEESDGREFAGQVVQGRVSEATLRALTRLFAEIEPRAYTAHHLYDRLRERLNTDTLSARAARVAEVYRRYLARVNGDPAIGPAGEGDVGRATPPKRCGPLGRALRAAQHARIDPPPFGARRFIFLGFDAMGASDIAITMLTALAENPHVAEVRLALVLPEVAEATGWRMHGNDTLRDTWLEHGGQRIVCPAAPVLAARHGARTDLAAMALDPFAHRLPSAPATGAVRGVRVPDAQTELEWVAADIKQRLLATAQAPLAERLLPDDICVIARDMDGRADDFRRAFERVGVPAYASFETAICDVPAVRAMLALYRLPAFGWRTADLLFVAESPYLHAGLDPALVAELGGDTTGRIGAADWRDRIARRLAQAEEAAARITALRGEDAATDMDARSDDVKTAMTALATMRRFATQFDRLVEQVTELTGDHEAPRLPHQWVESCRQAVERWANTDALYARAPLLSLLARTHLLRADLDGLNALLRGIDGWLAGREIARLAATALTPAEWYAELEAIAALTTIRMSTYPRDAVQLLDPVQAALRSWKVVYVVGLVDGVFPRHAQPDEHALSEEERAALQLATIEQRAAKERLLFHLAVATATEQLVLVAPAADDRGKALVTSPFLSLLPHRLTGFAIEECPVKALVPRRVEDVLSREDVDLLGAERYREVVTRTHPGAITQSGQRRDDALLAAWLSQPSTADTLERWAVERMRAGLESALQAGAAARTQLAVPEFAGFLPPDAVPASIRDATAAFSPSELETYETCHFKFYAMRVLGLRVDADDDDHDEAAAFGTLQHAVLETLYAELRRDGLLPPQSAAAIDEALARLSVRVPELVERHGGSGHTALRHLDYDFVTDVLRAFVRRDLGAMLRAATDPASPYIRTTLLACEAAIGGASGPAIPVDIDGVQFQLRGQIDRVEAIADPRLPEAAQGWLILRDYKSSRSAYAPRPHTYVTGKPLALPLYAYMAEQRWGTRVFGFGELRTSLPADPELCAPRKLEPNGEGGVQLVDAVIDPRSKRVIKNPVRIAMQAALRRAAELVRQMRSGDFTAQPGRKCFGCHLKDVCRAATMADPARLRRRAQMPVAVSVADYTAADRGPSAETPVPTASE